MLTGIYLSLLDFRLEESIRLISELGKYVSLRLILVRTLSPVSTSLYMGLRAYDSKKRGLS